MKNEVFPLKEKKMITLIYISQFHFFLPSERSDDNQVMSSPESH